MANIIDTGHWIIVENPKKIPKDHSTACEKAAIEINNYLQDTRRPQVHQLMDIMRRNKATSGKWFTAVSKDRWDSILEKMMEMVNKEELPEFRYLLNSSQPKVLLCVHSEDFDNEKEIALIEENLRLCGIKEKMFWKPDAYTHARIYKNHPKIRPYLFTTPWS